MDFEATPGRALGVVVSPSRSLQDLGVEQEIEIGFSSDGKSQPANFDVGSVGPSTKNELASARQIDEIRDSKPCALDAKPDNVKSPKRLIEPGSDLFRSSSTESIERKDESSSAGRSQERNRKWKV